MNRHKREATSHMHKLVGHLPQKWASPLDWAQVHLEDQSWISHHAFPPFNGVPVCSKWFSIMTQLHDSCMEWRPQFWTADIRSEEGHPITHLKNEKDCLLRFRNYRKAMISKHRRWSLWNINTQLQLPTESDTPWNNIFHLRRTHTLSTELKEQRSRTNNNIFCHTLLVTTSVTAVPFSPWGHMVHITRTH